MLMVDMWLKLEESIREHESSEDLETRLGEFCKSNKDFMSTSNLHCLLRQDN